MSLYHRRIDQRLDKIDKLIEPEAEMDPKRDHLIGVLSDDLKRFFTLWQSVVADFSKMEEERRKLVSVFLHAGRGATEELKARIRQAEADLTLLRDEETALKKMFWLSVKKEFPSAKDRPIIGVCKGFKVFWKEEEERKSPGIDIIFLSGGLPN